MFPDIRVERYIRDWVFYEIDDSCGTGRLYMNYLVPNFVPILNVIRGGIGRGATNDFPIVTSWEEMT